MLTFSEAILPIACWAGTGSHFCNVSPKSSMLGNGGYFYSLRRPRSSNDKQGLRAEKSTSMTPMDQVGGRVFAVIRHDLLACPTQQEAMGSIGSPSPEKGNMQAGMESWKRLNLRWQY